MIISRQDNQKERNRSRRVCNRDAISFRRFPDQENYENNKWIYDSGDISETHMRSVFYCG